MLELCWDIISICGNFLINWEGSYIIMAVLLIITAWNILMSLFVKGL